jgi:hypothetical protein
MKYRGAVQVQEPFRVDGAMDRGMDRQMENLVGRIEDADRDAAELG